MSFPCPKCGSPQVVRRGVDGRRFTECGSNTCTFNYKNQSKNWRLGKNRRHFKLTKEDYVEIHKLSDDWSIGYLARKFGVSRKQIKRVLNLNLSVYAQEMYNESPTP